MIQHSFSSLNIQHSSSTHTFYCTGAPTKGSLFLPPPQVFTLACMFRGLTWRRPGPRRPLWEIRRSYRRAGAEFISNASLVGVRCRTNKRLICQATHTQTPERAASLIQKDKYVGMRSKPARARV